MKKALLALLFIVLFFIFSPSKALADSNFSTSYDVTYTVNSSSTTRVSINAVLKNLTDRYYAPSYSIQVGFSDISNVSASDGKGQITPKVEKSTKGSIIALDFNDHVAGLGSENHFNISFDTLGVANNFNNVWDINIPGIANQNDFSSFNVTVIYPSFLGSPTFIKPAVKDINSINSGNQLTFSKDDLGTSGISIAFGEFQVYNFNLSYHLENKNLYTISTEIALPPTTNYQQVAIENLDPKPNNVKLDQDGNWLAQYIIPSAKTLNVLATGKIQVYLNPKEESLDANLAKKYLLPQSYWETTNPKIKSIAQNLKTPQAIYAYVMDKLSYDYSRIQTDSPRLGALGVLSKPSSAVCLEFTDLFVTLARAAGIPAREIDGYAYTNNAKDRPLSSVADILHAWPEYYDSNKNTWIMVDPTWGNTTGGIDYFNTLDFDHIAFTVKGLDSTYPVPAGGYKLDGNSNIKDVNIKLGTAFGKYSEQTNLSVEIASPLIAGMPINGFIKVANTGKTMLINQNASLTSNFLTPTLQTTNINAVPPFGYVLVPVSYDKTSFLTNRTDTIKITVNNNTSSKDLVVLPFFLSIWFIIGGITLASIAISLSIIAYLYRRISFYRQQRSNSLRGQSEELKS